MVDLLVQTSLAQLFFILKIFLTVVAQQATLIRRSIAMSLSPQLGIPGMAIA
jgi:hypothetical protein